MATVSVSVADAPRVRALFARAAAALQSRNSVILDMAADLRQMAADGAIELDQWPAAQALLAEVDDIPPMDAVLDGAS